MKILYILSSYNLYGGTPKKTLDLLNYFNSNAALYVYSKSHMEFKPEFENTGSNIYEGFYGYNYLKHILKLIKIIRINNIEIVQVQFSMGETLAFLIKLFIPNVKIVCAFVGAIKPSFIKSILINFFYKKFDHIIYVSEYVKKSKENQFPILKKKSSKVISNGCSKRIDNKKETIKMSKTSLLDVAGLVEYKNIRILIESMNILVNKRNNKKIFLYVAGDGPQKKYLEQLISNYNLKSYVNLIGYQKNIGRLLQNCDIFVHPCYVEGFGIVVIEAMHAAKPIIVSNAGALPEIIENDKTGIIVDPNSAIDWADAIEKYINNKNFALEMAEAAKIKASCKYNIDLFRENYLSFYNLILQT